MMQIATDRLILIAATPAILSSELAFLQDETKRHAFMQVLDADIGAWPPLYNDASTCSYALNKLTRYPNFQGWWSWYVLLKHTQELPKLVCSAGFHGPPSAEGSVEIGYSVLEAYQRQGIASESVTALTEWAFNHAEMHAQVNTVTITTLDLPTFMPSRKVALKCGFSFTGTRPDEEGTLLVYEINRDQFAKSRTKMQNTA